MRSGALRSLSLCAPRSRDFVVDERVSRLRKQHLAAVADGCDARAPVHVDPDVSLLGYTRLAGVEPHPDANRPIGQAALGVHGRGSRVRRPRERHEERITLGVDLDTVVVGTSRADDPALIVECVAVPVAELVQQPRRPLDVREEKGHHSTRELAWHATIISTRSTSVEVRLVRGKPADFVYRPCAVVNLCSIILARWRSATCLRLAGAGARLAQEARVPGWLKRSDCVAG